MTWKIGETLILKRDITLYVIVNGTRQARLKPEGAEVVLLWLPHHTYTPRYSDDRPFMRSYVGVVPKEVFVEKLDKWNAKKRKSVRWVARLFEGVMSTIPQTVLGLETVKKEGLKGLA